MNIAIIPARGGSKRIPHKNIRPFCGKPILSYSIQAAIDSGLFDEIMVSTDDEHIAEIAQASGAAVPFLRSEKNADDHATTADVLLEVLRGYEDKGKSFSTLCCLYPTAPFVTGEKLRSAMALLSEQDADAVFPVVSFSYPPLRGLVIKNGWAEMKWPEYLNTRSQDLDSLYHDSGQFYLIRTQEFQKQKTLFCKKSAPILVSELEVQDIDSEVDWILAELKYKFLQEGAGPK